MTTLHKHLNVQKNRNKVNKLQNIGIGNSHSIANQNVLRDLTLLQSLKKFPRLK